MARYWHPFNRGASSQRKSAVLATLFIALFGKRRKPHPIYLLDGFILLQMPVSYHWFQDNFIKAV